MRWIIVIAIGALACGKGENAGIEEAKKQAQADQKAAESKGEVAKKIRPPVPGNTKLPCSQVVDPAKFQQALGEKDPVAVVDGKDPEAPAACAINRGGKRPTQAEQLALKKQNGRLGVMPGDEICTVTTYCWTIEDPERFKKKCIADKRQLDDSFGFPTCYWIVPTGADDVKHFQLYDDDTKCIFDVHGGPSNVDNDLIAKCAKAAHDLIGPEEIAVKGGGTGSGG
jgi:hypothetical protein